MGIDRIGKGGAPPTPEAEGVGKAAKTEKTEKTFSVERPDAAHAAKQTSAVEGANATSPLARLRAGEIDVNGYVDLKVEEATRGLEGLSSSDLQSVKKILREQLATDPQLSDLVHTATGQTPSIPEE